ncbi:MAG: SPOR domain-containing protein [Holosporales bacterium]|jgi:cbb3-type cytochrome oxidase subunit 3|nr:SPOR domain-containing protein [Holosporales bacterium]
MKQINFRKANNKQNYLKYNDVFMSRNGPDNQSYHSGYKQKPRQTPQNNADYDRYDNPTPQKFQRPDREEYEYPQDDQYLDQFDEYDEIGPQNRSRNRFPDVQPMPREREYFSQGSNIIDDKMIRYQKRQLPPLHRYGNSSRDSYPDPRIPYWDEDADDYETRRQRQFTSFGAIWHKFIVTFASILSLVCITWIAYNWSNDKRASASSMPVIIEPDQQSFKVLPDNPGGMEVPHQDKTVYERVNPSGSRQSLEERLLPPPEDPIDLTPKHASGISGNVPDIEEYSIVDDKTYYIKISAGKSKHVLQSEAKLLKKKFATLLSEVSCVVKKVSNARGEQKYAILIGPFDSQDGAVDIARNLDGECYIVSVREQ